MNQNILRDQVTKELNKNRKISEGSFNFDKNNPLKNIHENDIIMVLDKLYVQRTKRRMSSSFPNGITLKMWHLKVLIDNQIGQVSIALNREVRVY